MIIKCKSDLLVSTGDSFNSTVDVDVCYDELGLVYIPAKSIKGIIREAAFDTNSNELLEILGGRGDRNEDFIFKIDDIINSSNRQLKSKYKNRDFMWVGPKRLKRNAEWIDEQRGKHEY